jgi:uracil-DNA glycosylase
VNRVAEDGGRGLAALVAEVRACRACAAHLPLGPRPVLRAEPSARLLIIGQAPGTRVHETGIPWNDASGDRLRDWLALDRATFYDAARIAIIPMGFCYPGRDARGGDNPPRPECAPLWHERLLAHLPALRLTLLVGRYAHGRYIAGARRLSLAETVCAWRDHTPDVVPLPHPSWRTTAWQRKHPWFDAELLPDLRQRVREVLG